MDEEQFYIWSMEHTAWWRANSNGYTTSIDEAGKYSRAECDKLLFHANWGSFKTKTAPHEAMIPVSTHPH
jgi:hypothetical protein